MTKITATSKKKEILFVNPYLTTEKTNKAEQIIELLKEYQQTYIRQIREEATTDEVLIAIKTNSGKQLLETKHAKDKVKLEQAFPNLDEEDALEMLSKQSKSIVDSLITLGTEINNKLKGTGLQLENFVLNNEFVMNSKVEGRIKNMSAIVCQNQKQKDLRDLAMKLSKHIKGALKTGLLAPNRLGAVGENIIDINTGEIKHKYIMQY